MAANRLRSGSRKRSKEIIGTVRHPYLHFDIAREVRPTSVGSDTVPTPTAFLSTSIGKYQPPCRVDSFTFEQESALRLLAIPLSGDLAYADCDRGLGMPGFRNCRYDQPCPVTVMYPSDSTLNPGDFRLDIAAANAMLLSHTIPSRKHSGERTNFDHDWAPILHELAHGEDAAKLTRTLAFRPSDNPVIFLRPADDSTVLSARFCRIEGVAMRTLSHCVWSTVDSGLPQRCVSVEADARARWRRLQKKLTSGVESAAFVEVLRA